MQFISCVASHSVIMLHTNNSSFHFPGSIQVARGALVIGASRWDIHLCGNSTAPSPPIMVTPARVSYFLLLTLIRSFVGLKSVHIAIDVIHEVTDVVGVAMSALFASDVWLAVGWASVICCGHLACWNSV